MANKIERIYMDACCFIELAGFETGHFKTERHIDVTYAAALLEAAFDGEIEIYTSMLSVPECQCVKDEDTQERILTDAVKDAFRKLLTSGQYVLLIQDSILVAEQARDLIWVHGISLQGADAMHIASALTAGCREFLTFDAKGILSKSEILEDKLGLRAITPRHTLLCPQSKHPLPGGGSGLFNEYQEAIIVTPVDPATGSASNSTSEASEETAKGEGEIGE